MKAYVQEYLMKTKVFKYRMFMSEVLKQKHVLEYLMRMKVLKIFFST